MNDTFPHRFTRTVDLYGAEGFARVRAGGAIVVGLGGVGAHCAVALARSGVGRLKLIDFDRVTTSSLNRHPLAGPADVDRLKTDVLASSFAVTCPDTAVEAVVARVASDNIATLVPAGDRELYPVLVDCIDSVPAKIALLVHGLGHGWRVICSMGAAGKRGGGLVRTGALADTRVCPLARKVRRSIRDAGVDPGSIAAVWSEEPPRAPVTAVSGGHLPDEPGMVRRQPSNMMLPGMVGYALATLAVEALVTE